MNEIHWQIPVNFYVISITFVKKKLRTAVCVVL